MRKIRTMKITIGGVFRRRLEEKARKREGRQETDGNRRIRTVDAGTLGNHETLELGRPGPSPPQSQRGGRTRGAAGTAPS